MLTPTHVAAFRILGAKVLVVISCVVVSIIVIFSSLEIDLSASRTLFILAVVELYHDHRQSREVVGWYHGNDMIKVNLRMPVVFTLDILSKFIVQGWKDYICNSSKITPCWTYPSKSPHHSDEMSQWSQISGFALWRCSPYVIVLSLSFSLFLLLSFCWSGYLSSSSSSNVSKVISHRGHFVVFLKRSLSQDVSQSMSDNWQGHLLRCRLDS